MIKYFIPFFVICSNIVFSQRTPTGFIYDKKYNTPVEFANVVIDRNNGTMTDASGRFVLTLNNNAPVNDTIIISHISYNIVKIPLDKIASFLNKENTHGI